MNIAVLYYNKLMMKNKSAFFMKKKNIVQLKLSFRQFTLFVFDRQQSCGYFPHSRLLAAI